MPLDPDAVQSAKSAAARHAAQLVEDGMCVGLGSGSTAEMMIAALGERVAAGEVTITAVPTSPASAERARVAGIALVGFETASRLDLTLDGADEVDGRLDMIKGGGGALWHEKIVAAASQRMVAIIDADKEVARLGAFPLPVEVAAFGCAATGRQITEALGDLGHGGGGMALRMAGGAPFETEEGNFVIDLPLGRIGDARRMAEALEAIPGVVAHGLFLGLCDLVVVGDGAGETTLRAGTRSENLFLE